MRRKVAVSATPADPPTDPHFLPLTVFLAQAAGSHQARLPLPEVIFIDPNLRPIRPQARERRAPAHRHPARRSLRLPGPQRPAQWTLLEGLRSLLHLRRARRLLRSRRLPRAARRPPKNTGWHFARPMRRSFQRSGQPAAGRRRRVRAKPTRARPTQPSRTPRNSAPTWPPIPPGPTRKTARPSTRLGVRVPFLAISAFSKPHYVSHTTGSHTSVAGLHREPLP